MHDYAEYMSTVCSKLPKVPKFLLNKLKEFSKIPSQIRHLSSTNYKIRFVHEGNVEIKLQPIGMSQFLSPHRFVQMQNTIKFSMRPNAEVQLRKIVFELFQSNLIDKNKSVIDIGGWIGDNSLVWATLLRNNGQVYSVDPSPNNLKFIQKVASFNSINNLELIKAICSDMSNLPVEKIGSIDHAQFSTSNVSTGSAFLTTTLDNVIPFDKHNEIALLHIDVEGFEEKVLLGATSILINSKPVIIFEQHINQDDTSKIIDFLTSQNYELFMINEVLPGCNLDCRNFLAANRENNFSDRVVNELKIAKSSAAWSAVPGQPLIKFEL
jgi:FkbM family methyltransferase